MKRLVFVVLLVPIALIMWIGGCGPRTEVLKDKVLAKVDSLLGELDVKRKTVEQGVAQLKDARNMLAKGQIRLEVQAEQLGSQVAEKGERKADTENALKRVGEYLKAKSPARIGGKTYSKEQLEATANELLASRAAQGKSLTAIQRARDILQHRAEELKRMLGQYDQKMSALENKITEMDAAATALRALKDASQAVDGSGASFADNFDKVQKQVDSLCADVETELRFEDLRWRENSADKPDRLSESLAQTPKEEKDTIAEIEKALKN